MAVATLVERAVGFHDPRHQPCERQYQNVLFFESTDERETIR